MQSFSLCLTKKKSSQYENLLYKWLQYGQYNQAFKRILWTICIAKRCLTKMLQNVVYVKMLFKLEFVIVFYQIHIWNLCYNVMKFGVFKGFQSRWTSVELIVILKKLLFYNFYDFFCRRHSLSLMNRPCYNNLF